MPKYHQGKFRPKYPEKYLGDPTNIIYRSGFELKLMRYLDHHPKVVGWASEELIIPYRSPLDNKIHRYFPDFFVKQIDKDGVKRTIVIEVKPKYQTVPPVKKSKVTKRYLNEVKTWGINQAKWAAAEAYCADRGWVFQKFTEDELGIK